MMRRIKTSALIFVMLALLVALFSFGAANAVAATATNNDVEYIGEDGSAVIPEPVDVPELEGTGIMAISAELDPDSELVPTARVGGEIVPFDTLIYKVMHVSNQWIVIVGGELPEGTPLPATIEVAVPAGSPVFWFGEVGESGDPTQDPRFPHPYEMRTEGNFDVYTATMGTYLNMQIEYRLHQSPFVEGPEGPMVDLEYTPWQSVRQLRLAAALPETAAVAATDIEMLGRGPDGSVGFARVFEDAQAGQLYSTEITYTLTGRTTAESTLNPVVVPALIAVLVAVAAIVIVLFARSSKSGHSHHNVDDYYKEEELEEEAEEERELQDQQNENKPWTTH